MKFYRINIFP